MTSPFGGSHLLAAYRFGMSGWAPSGLVRWVRPGTPSLSIFFLFYFSIFHLVFLNSNWIHNSVLQGFKLSNLYKIDLWYLLIQHIVLGKTYVYNCSNTCN
jgi:hypothetical protein